MIKILLAALIVFFIALPANATKLAVFCMEPKYYSSVWIKEHPAILVKADSWRYLEEFLYRASYSFYDDEELIIDIDCHGDPKTGQLALADGSRTSMGSVLERINYYFPNRNNMVVIFEACYAGRCYKLTSRGGSGYLPGGIKSPPRYPIYGIEDRYSNFNNMSYLQYKKHLPVIIRDLREYETAPIASEYKSMGIWEILFNRVDPIYSFLFSLWNILIKP